MDGFEIVDVTENTSKDFLSADCTDFRRLFSLGFSSAFICVHLRNLRIDRLFSNGQRMRMALNTKRLDGNPCPPPRPLR